MIDRTPHILLVALIVAICRAPIPADAQSFRNPHSSPETGTNPPNIVVILADDMGFSDIGSYGGEIDTPNLDRLAAEGLRYSNFYNAGRCCPTRASLLTGLYPHRAEMGWMTAADMGRAGYHNDLAKDAVTIAEALEPAGYRSMVSGKWHVSADGGARKEKPDRSNWPLQRGFDRFYGTFAGGGYFAPRKDVMTDNENTPEMDPDFYYTDAITKNAVGFIEKNCRKPDAAPIFLYVAYTAPHFPLQAPEPIIRKYKGRFDEGWDVLRERRLKKLKEMGIIDPATELGPRAGKPWSETTSEERADLTRRMEVYAAMVDVMDQGIGRLLDALERCGKLDNTLVMFLSDNGSTEEDFISPGTEPDPSVIGGPKYRGMVRAPWANLSNAPFRLFKSYAHEGGIATPLIVRWGGRIPDPGAVRRRVGHVIDLLPTCLEVAGTEYPAKRGETALKPVQGKSLVSSFAADEPGHAILGWEHEGNRGIRKGEWKLVAAGVDGAWELFDLTKDRTETHDLASAHPDKVGELTADWTRWAEANDVLPLDGRSWEERVAEAKAAGR